MEFVRSWVRYESPNYTNGIGNFPNNDFTCESRPAYIGSVRNAGHATDISISTISLFDGLDFNGNMTQYTSNVANYDGTFSSFIITPPGVATFYTETNFGGISICLQPIPGFPTHWRWDIHDLGIEPGDVKSMKLGCDSTNIHYSSPISSVKE